MTAETLFMIFSCALHLHDTISKPRSIKLEKAVTDRDTQKIHSIYNGMPANRSYDFFGRHPI